MLGISRRAKLQKGETILITAAAGGLGLAAVDIAANIYKAKVEIYRVMMTNQNEN